jgi:CheY-like chemotaxis protein
MSPRTVLVVDAGGHPLEPVAQRLRLLGIAALRAKTAAEAHTALADPRAAIGAVLIPPDPPALDLPRALRALTKAPDGGVLPLLVCGPRPEPEARARLREAGAELALWEPLDDHTLRFQVNRALAGPKTIDGRRRTVRAPADWPVSIRTGARKKDGRLYSVSATGAFVAIDQPSVVRAEIGLDLVLPGMGRLAVSGRVAMTNVPGNLARRTLPYGMGVQFEQLSEAASVALLVYSQDRFRSLSL